MVRRQRRYPSRAARAQARISRDYPLRRYGRAYYERGSADSRALFGPTLKAAKEAAAAGNSTFLDNRRKYGYRGRGGYIGRTLGRFAGDKIGLGSAGAIIGDKAGDWLWGKTKGLLGMGMYDGMGYDGRGSYTSTNSLMSGSNRTPPQFGSVSDETGALIVSHREYICDLYGPSTDKRDFSVQAYELNPGLERTFPWLSQLAQNYEEYEFGQLVFEYKSTVDSSVAGDGQVGTVVMVTNYNSASRPFDDKATMMQYDGSNSCRTTSHAVHGVECDPAKLSGAAGHYVRVKPKSGQDLKTYDHGLFQFATVGMPGNFDNATIGELWVTYTIKLRKPRLFSARGLNLSRDMYLCNLLSTTENSGTGIPISHAVTNNIGTLIRYAGDQDISKASVESTVNGVLRAGWDPQSAIGTGGFYDIVFPASYSGSVEIKLTMTGQFTSDVDSANYMRGINYVFGYATGPAPYATSGVDVPSYVDDRVLLPHSTDQYVRDANGEPVVKTPAAGGAIATYRTASGNVDVINDIFGVYPGSSHEIKDHTDKALHPRWCSCAALATAAWGGDMQNRAICTAHLRIQQATAGQENIARIWLPKIFNTLEGNQARAQISIDISEYNTFDLPLSRPYPQFENDHGVPQDVLAATS